jgi:Tol biopolymer transport system component
MSSSPDETLVMDVIGHRMLWVSPANGGAPYAVFEFENSDDRIDYPNWSPDGKWVLFDRVKPEGGDIWVIDNLQ